MRRQVALVVAVIVCSVGGAMVSVGNGPHPGPPQFEAAPSVAVSAASSPSSGWENLTTAEQRTLQPLRAEWGALEPDAKAYWIAIADRLKEAPASSVALARGRMAAWQHLDSGARARVRQHYLVVSRLSPAERRRRWIAYEQSLYRAGGSSATAPHPQAGLPVSAARPSSAGGALRRPPDIHSTMKAPRMTVTASSGDAE